jgi:hypothetical protein
LHPLCQEFWIRDARAALIRRGRRIAGVVPFGYVADRITKQLRPVPAEAVVVRQLFEWAAGGKRPSEIAHLAGGRHWRTRRGSPWTPRQVVETLSNPIYAGRLGSAASPREGCHEAIVSQELFEKARGAIEARRTRPPSRRPGVASFLQGRVRCAACGRLMSVHSNRRGCVEHRHFRCTESGGLPRCQGTHVRVATLESEVLSIFVEPEKRIKRGRGRPDRFMTTLFAFAQIFPTLSPAAQDEFAREVIGEVVWDASAGKARIRLNPAALRRRYVERPFHRAAVLFAEAFCELLADYGSRRAHSRNALVERNRGYGDFMVVARGQVRRVGWPEGRVGSVSGWCERAIGECTRGGRDCGGMEGHSSMLRVVDSRVGDKSVCFQPADTSGCSGGVGKPAVGAGR